MAETMATWRLIISRVDDEHIDVGSEREGEYRDDFNNGQWCFYSSRY